MRTQRLFWGHWMGIIVSLLVLGVGTLAAGAQTCGTEGCWELHEAIYIYGNSDFTCENGVVSGSGSQYDPYVIEGHHVLASGASYGINVEYTSAHFVIRNCIVEGASEAGIRFYSVSNGSIQDSHLMRNERGILFESSRDNGIVGNLIAMNHYGVDLVIGTRDTAISKNSFIDNGRHGYDPAGRNRWSCAAIGNYWADYDGRDVDCDGIGDTPYRAPMDWYPLMTSPWQCALPVNDICGLHCGDSTDVLKAMGTPSTGPCATPCAPVSSCTSTPRCAAPAPICRPDITTCSDQVLSCVNPVATLTAEFCPSRSTCQPCVIQWVKDGGPVMGTGPTIQVSEPGIYTVSIAGADGCGASKSITVISDENAPVVRASVNGTLSCGLDEVLLEATISGGHQPYAIEWSRSGMGVVGCETCLLVSQPGTYTVTVTGANGCTSSDTITVSQDLQPPRIQAIVSDELSCSVQQVKLTALASNGRLPYAYEWRDPSGSPVGTASELYVSHPGTYSVRVSGANGCSATGTVIVTEDVGAPVVDIRGSGTLTCTIEEIALTANVSSGRPPYHVEWVGPSGNIVGTAPLIQATQPGTYTVTVTGANGCASSASLTIEQDIVPPSVDAGPDHLLTTDFPQVSITATIENPGGGVAVEWTNESGDLISTMETVSIDRPGEYTVTVTRDTGCRASDSVIVNSTVITEVMLDSGIEGLAVFGQLTMDGVPIPESTFYFRTGDITSAEGVEISSLSLRSGTGEGWEANGAEVNYIIPGNSVVTFQIHKDQFVAGKWYNLPHLPIDPPGAAAVKFF